MEQINLRLKKIIGQLNAIIKMNETEQDCEKIIIQFQAVKAAIDSAFSETLNVNLENCLMKKNYTSMKNIIKLISKK